MEEAVKDALLTAAEFLAGVLREGLIRQGFDVDLSVRAEDGRVAFVSQSRAVWLAEMGDAGVPPTVPLTGLASRAASDVAGVLRDHLEGAWL